MSSFGVLVLSWGSLWHSGTLLGLSSAHLGLFFDILSSFGLLWGAFWSPLTPFISKNQQQTMKQLCFWRVPKSLRGCFLAHYWSLWLSFWLPLAQFRCLRDPLWCPKSPLGLSLRLWDALGALFGTSRTLFWYLELIWSSFECLLISSDPPLPTKKHQKSTKTSMFLESP